MIARADLLPDLAVEFATLATLLLERPCLCQDVLFPSHSLRSADCAIAYLF